MVAAAGNASPQRPLSRLAAVAYNIGLTRLSQHHLLIEVMCLLAIFFRPGEESPLWLAANREESYSRPSRLPEIYGDHPPVLCGTDLTAGGTWLGVNSEGVVAGVTNRAKSHSVKTPRSRGMLCRDVLRCRDVQNAADLAVRELRTNAYNGVNFFIADASRAVIIHGGNDIEQLELEPGLHLLTNANVDDPRDPRQATAREMLTGATINSSAESVETTFIETAKTVCRYCGDDDATSRSESIIIRQPQRGTVSSTIATISAEAEGCRYLFAPGPPDRTDYIDLSDELRLLLGRAS